VNTLTPLKNEPPMVESFIPPQRLLMGAGPSRVHKDVLNIMSQTTIGHLDPEMIKMMDELKEMLRYAFQTKNSLTFPVSGPGSLGMEACVNNIVEPNQKVLIAINGVFGSRMAEVARRAGADVITTEDEWGKAVDINKVKDAIDSNPEISTLGFVHAETSTGVMSDAGALCQLAANNNIMTIVDTVTSLAGIPVNVDVWGADAVYSGTQKCLSCPPGLSPVTFSEKAVEKVLNRSSPVQSWLLDLSLVANYWQGDSQSGVRTYHHTAPVNALMGLHEALRRVVAEGLDGVWARHRETSNIIVTGLESMGFKMLVDQSVRLPELLTVLLPTNLEDGPVRSRLLNEFNIEISAGLGPFAGKLWRIGVMGEGARPKNAQKLLEAIDECLKN